ncbi:MAG: hypothetical protein WKF73_21600 [Nocardioidaceae bacterium]
MKTVASTGEGIDDLVEAIAKHRRGHAGDRWTHCSPGTTGQGRGRGHCRDHRFVQRFGDVHGHGDLDALAAEVAGGDLDPYTAADRLLAAL